MGEVRGSCPRDSPGIPAPARKRPRGARTSEQQGTLRTHSPLPGCESRGGGKLGADRRRDAESRVNILGVNCHVYLFTLDDSLAPHEARPQSFPERDWLLGDV